MAKKKKGQRADGRYVSYRTINGKKKPFYSYESKAVADKIADKAVEEHKEKARVTPNYRDVYFSQWIDEWLKTVKKPSVEEDTYDEYSDVCRLHIKPELGTLMLNEIDIPHVRNLINTKLETLSGRRVQFIYDTLKGCLQQAVNDRIIVFNACNSIKRPTVKNRDFYIFTDNDTKKFLEEIKKYPLYPLFALAWSTGMRQGELMGLRWSEVDFKRNEVTIIKAVKNPKSGRKLSNPKNDSSRRTITIPPEITKILQDWQIKQQKHIQEYGIRYKNNNLLFPKLDGSLKGGSDVYEVFKTIANKIGLPDNVRFHDLRHNHATQLFKMGVHPKIVQYRLGHATIQITMDTYTHVIPNMQEGIAGQLSHVFTGGQKGGQNPEKIKGKRLRKIGAKPTGAKGGT